MSEILQLDFTGNPNNFEDYGDAKESNRIIQEMYNKLVPIFGITQRGPFVTLRFGSKELQTVTLMVISIDNGLLDPVELEQ